MFLPLYAPSSGTEASGPAQLFQAATKASQALLAALKTCKGLQGPLKAQMLDKVDLTGATGLIPACPAPLAALGGVCVLEVHSK